MSWKIEANNLNRMAVMLQAQGRARESLAAFQQALELFRSSDDLAGVGRCLNGVGALYKDLGEPERARENLEQALSYRQMTGDERGEAITLTTLGPVYAKLGQPEKARDVLLRAHAITRAIFDSERYGQVLFNLGEVALMLGQPWEALKWLREDLVIVRSLEDKVEENKCLNLLTMITYNLGQIRQARRYGLESLALARKHGNLRGESCALDNLGHIIQRSHSKDKWAQAQEFFERSLAIDRETQVMAEAAVTMNSLAAVYLNMEQYAKARALIDEAMQIAKKAGASQLEATTWHTLGALHLKLNERSQAIECFDKALRFWPRTENRLFEAGVLRDKGLALWDDGDEQRALKLFEEAASIYDTARSEISEDYDQTFFFAQYNVQDIYHIYSARLLQMFEKTSDRSYAERAFHVCERRHARALLDLLRAKGMNGAAHNARNLNVPLTLREVQAQLLDKDTVLLVYSVHLAVSYIWVLTHDNFEVHKIGADSYALRAIVKELRRALDSPSPTAYLDPAHELYTLLVEPAERLIEGKRQLLIVPDDALQVVPFQMLLTEEPSRDAPTPAGRGLKAFLRHFIAEESFPAVQAHVEQPFLIKKHTIAYAPSASIFHALREVQRAKYETPRLKEFIAFAPIHFTSAAGSSGIKPLPASRDEVNNIGALFDSSKVTFMLEDDATKENVLRDELKDYRFIHFATHAYFNREDAETSAIILRDHSETVGHLYTSDIAKLQLNAEMVTLSACETGLGEVTDEGILGLMRAFFCAGSATVCSSLWGVDDRATAEIMRGFYHQILVSKKTKAEALRDAQMELVRSNNWSLPQYWAPFILAGDWS